MGHALVVHDFHGRRAACGIVQPAYLMVPGFIPYLSYSGDLRVMGTVQVYAAGARGSHRHVSWSLIGVDPKCVNRLNVEKSCGLHIHRGTSCKAHAGAHYYAGREDPWKGSYYKATVATSGIYDGIYVARGSIEVNDELNNYLVMGHVFIVHDYQGSPAACGIVQPT